MRTKRKPHFYFKDHTKLFRAKIHTCFTFRKSEIFWSLFCRIWNEYGDLQGKSPYSVRMQENTDQKNSEYGHFSNSVSAFH